MIFSEVFLICGHGMPPLCTSECLELVLLFLVKIPHLLRSTGHNVLKGVHIGVKHKTTLLDILHIRSVTISDFNQHSYHGQSNSL